MLLGVRPTDRGILAATLAFAAAATLALTPGYLETAGRLLSHAPAAIDGAQAATARGAPAPGPARRKRDVPAPATMVGDQRSVVLYLLMEAARPQSLFAR